MIRLAIDRYLFTKSHIHTTIIDIQRDILLTNTKNMIFYVGNHNATQVLPNKIRDAKKYLWLDSCKWFRSMVDKIYFASRGARTYNPEIKNLMLYQLS